MFDKLSIDERLSAWLNFRKGLESDSNPFNSVAEFWSLAPLIVHNTKIDPYNSKSWPTPWDIISRNKYDDFTIAVMMGYTVKLTERFSKDFVVVKTMVDHSKKQLYNLLYINEEDVLNYKKHLSVKIHDIEEDLYLENSIDIIFPR